MKTELELLKEANDLLRSINSIIERRGASTNWLSIEKQVKQALTEQHEVLYPKKEDDMWKDGSALRSRYSDSD